MQSLNKYTDVDYVRDGTCDVCSSREPVVGFWEDHDMSSDPAYQLCVEHLLESSGRFMNLQPREILSQFEEVQYVERDDNRIEIVTESPLGEFTHVHYIEPAICPIQSGDDPRGRPEFAECVQLTGESELFDDEGVAIGNTAGFMEVATRAVLQENHERFQGRR